MKVPSLLATAFVVLLVPAVQAAPPTTLSASHVDYAGAQETQGLLAALRLESSVAQPTSFRLVGEDVRLHTVNQTIDQAMQVGYLPDRGGTDRSWPLVTLVSGPARSQLDFLVTPVPGQPPPTVRVGSALLEVVPTDTDRVVEWPYVNESRPVHAADTSKAILGKSMAAVSLHVEGAFQVSVWSWNFTADDGRTREAFPTGVQQSNVVRDPATGQVVSSTNFDQVAQVVVGHGTLEIARLGGVSASLHSNGLAVSNAGRAVFEGVHGILDAEGAGTLDGQAITAEGHLSAGHHADGRQVSAVLGSFTGTMAVGGEPVDLGDDGPLQGAQSGGRAIVEPDGPWMLGVGGSLALLVLGMLVAKGPARTARFNHIQGRFEAKDYEWVLRRIEPFTSSRRHRRRATVLKAVSLLSLEDYREAALFLESLDPARGPDSATKAFLQACAAAGLGQDSFAIQHLTDCFRLDPTYMDEARAVPVLAGYLPYFSISAETA